MSAMEKKMNILSEIESKLDSIFERLSDNGTGTGGSTGLATMETKLNSIIEHLPSAGLKDIKESLDKTKANVETVSKEINCTGYTPWNTEKFDISVIQLGNT